MDPEEQRPILLGVAPNGEADTRVDRLGGYAPGFGESMIDMGGGAAGMELGHGISDMVSAAANGGHSRSDSGGGLQQLPRPGTGGAAKAVAAKDRAAQLKEKAEALKAKARKLKEDAEEKRRAAERAGLEITRKAQEKEEREAREREKQREREKEHEQELEREQERGQESDRIRELEVEREQKQEKQGEASMQEGTAADEQKEVVKEEGAAELVRGKGGDEEQVTEMVQNMEKGDDPTERDWRGGAESAMEVEQHRVEKEHIIDPSLLLANAASLPEAVEALVVVSRSFDKPRTPLNKSRLGSGDFSRLARQQSLPEQGEPNDTEIGDAEVNLLQEVRMGRLRVQIPDRILELQMEDLPEFPGGFGEKASPAEDAAARAMLEISMTPTDEVHSRGGGFRDSPTKPGSDAPALEVTEGRAKRKRKPNRMYFDDDATGDWLNLDTPKVVSEPEKKTDSAPKPKKRLKITFKGAHPRAAEKQGHAGKKMKNLAVLKSKTNAGRKSVVHHPKPKPLTPNTPAEARTPEGERLEDARCPVCQAVGRLDCGLDAAHPRCVKAAGADNAALQGGANAKAAAVVLLAALKGKKGAALEPWAASREEQLERVPVWEPSTGERLVGNEAPRLRNLWSWLLLHPGWEVMPPEELDKPPPVQELAVAPPTPVVVAPLSEAVREWRETEGQLSLLLQAWSSLRARGDAACFGSSKEAVAACRFLDPDFGPLCDLLGEYRYSDLGALLADFARACNTVAVVRINDLKKGCYPASSLCTSPARLVGAAEILIKHGSADLRGLADVRNGGRVLTDAAMLVRNQYTNKEPMGVGPWRREPWPSSTLPYSASGARKGRAPALDFDADVRAVDGWGIDPFTRRSILDALPKGPAREGTPMKSRGKTIGEVVTQKLLQAMNDRGSRGWDVFESLKAVGLAGGRSRDASVVEAVTELAHKMMEAGPLWFKVHPKGTSLLCQRAGGLDAGTCVASYPSDAVYTPHRWFELQEGLRKNSVGASQKPANRVDFLLVEQPADSEDGYGVLFVDVRNREGAPPRQLLHSCQATCNLVVKHVGTRPAVEIYTAHKVERGQELTLKYMCYTTSDADVTQNVCLCGTACCRGSCYVHLGRGPASVVLNEIHSLPDRLALVLRASSEKLSSADQELIATHGFERALPTKGEGRAPAWLHKWLALTLRFVEREQELLPRALQAAESNYGKTSAAAEAKNLLPLRLQHLAMTLDRVRHCLSAQTPETRERPPLRALSPVEVCEYLWTGRRSVGRCLVGRLAPVLCPDCTARGKERLKLSQHSTPGCAALHRALRTPSTDLGGSPTVVIKAALNRLAADLRTFESDVCVAARDLLRFLTSTETFVQAHRYEPVTSPPIAIHVADTSRGSGKSSHLQPSENAGFADGAAGSRPNGAATSPLKSAPPEARTGKGLSPNSRVSRVTVSGQDSGSAASPSGQVGGAGREMLGSDAARGPSTTNDSGHVAPSTSGKIRTGATGQRSDGPIQNRGHSALHSFEKVYPGDYILAQLLFWHLNVPGFDPATAFGKEAPGTCLLPDPESVTREVAPGERATWLGKLATDPGGLWPSQWSFKEDLLQATLGSPLVDAAVRRQVTNEAGPLRLPLELLEIV